MIFEADDVIPIRGIFPRRHRNLSADAYLSACTTPVLEHRTNERTFDATDDDDDDCVQSFLDRSVA